MQDKDTMPVDFDSARVGGNGLMVRTPQDLTLLAQMVSRSGLAPDGLKTVPQIAVAIQTGLEIGLKPMQALQSICVIKGKAALYGDGATGLVNGSGQVVSWDEWYELDGVRLERPPTSADLADGLTAVCKIQRKNRVGAAMGAFSVADARRARLLSKSGPWTEYPLRMLMWRARSWAMRDGFSDVLRGIGIAEEVMDTPRQERGAEFATLATLGPKKLEPAETEADAEVVAPARFCGGSTFLSEDEPCPGCADCEGEGA